MNSLSSLLTSLAASCESGEPQKEGTIHTITLLRHLSVAPHTPLAPHDAETIHRLCRKVEVARAVWTEYGSSWKKAGNASPLPPAGWSLLVAVLLALAQTLGLDRRLALKCLNAALRALTITENADPMPERETLCNLAEACVERLCHRQEGAA